MFMKNLGYFFAGKLKLEGGAQGLGLQFKILVTITYNGGQTQTSPNWVCINLKINILENLYPYKMKIDILLEKLLNIEWE